MFPEMPSSCLVADNRSLVIRPGVLVRLLSVGVMFLSVVGLSFSAESWAAIKRTTHLQAQGLGPALETLAKEHGFQVLYRTEIVGTLRSRSLDGEFTRDEALRELLQGTGLTYRALGETAITVVPVTELSPTGATSNVSGAGRESAEGLDGKNPPAGRSFRDRLRVAQAAADVSGGSAAVRSSAESGFATLEEVVVTAQKRVQRAIDVPMSISALSEEALSKAGIQTVKGLADTVPGLVVIERGPGSAGYFIRGIGNANGSQQPLVSIYLDDADVTSSGAAQLDLRLVDLERVEVLKGPQGTLYGQGAAGGAIRFITNDPQLNEFSGSADVQAYFTRYADPSQQISGVLNLPIVEDELGVRLSGVYGNLGGWIDQPAAGRSDVNDQNLREVRMKTLWKPSENLSVKATVLVHRNEGDGINSGADENYDQIPAVRPDAAMPYIADFNVYNVTASYDLSAVNILSSSTYLDSSSEAGASFKYFLFAPPVPMYELLTNPVQVRTHSFSQEIRLSSNTDSRFRWLAGGYYKDQTLDRLSTFEQLLFGATFPGSIVANDASESVSAFAEASYALTQRLEVGAGIRYFHDDVTNFQGVAPRDASFHSVDPRLYVSYKVADNIRVYANAASGFRSGGFNGGNGLPEGTYDPEKVRSYEIGTKMVLFDNRLNADIAVFLSDYTDIQAFRVTTSGLGTTENAGEARVKGIDWSFNWLATERLSLTLAGNWTDAKYESVAPGVLAVQEGDWVDFTTEYRLNVGANYDFEWAGTLPGFARIDYGIAGPQHATDRGNGVPIVFETDIIRLLNARMGLQLDQWSFELFGENLTDSNGMQDAFWEYGAGSRPRPRTVGLRAKVDFQ